MGLALRMWYVYNKRALRQSNDLCRVVVSHHNLMKTPRSVMEKVYDQLNECGVDVPHRISDKDINYFIDLKLTHGKLSFDDKICDSDYKNLLPSKNVWDTTEKDKIALYRECMRVYCALENGSAFSLSFTWDESIAN